MATVLQIVNPSDLTTSYFDLNDATGANSGEYGGVRTQLRADPVFGSPDWQFDRLQPPGISGGTTTFQRAGLRTMLIGLVVKGSSYDGLVLATNRLGDLLSNGVTMRWQPDGSASVRFIDVEPSPTPALINGQELALYDAITAFQTLEGVTLDLTVQPFLRGAALSGTANILNNPTLLRDANVDGTPNGWTTTAAMTGETVLASAEALQFTVADAAPQTVQQEPGGATGTVSSGQTWTLQYEARIVSSPTTGCKMQAWLDWHTAAHGFISATAGTLVQLTSQWQTISHTATAPATTDHASVNLYMDNDNATSFTVQVRNAQFIQAASVQPFRVGDETVLTDPTGTGFATILPVYNPSEAPAPCSFLISAPDASSKVKQVHMGMQSSRRITGAGSMTDYLNGPFYANADQTGNGWTVALDPGTVDAGAYASATLSAGAQFTRLEKFTRTTLLDSLRGEHDVWARVRAQTAANVAGVTSGSSTTDGTTFTTASVQLQAGHLYWIVLNVSHASGADSPSSVTHSAGTFTQGGGGGLWNSLQCKIWTGYLVPLMTATGTITITMPATHTGCNWHVFELINIDTTNGGQIQNVSASQTSTSPSVTMSAFSDVRNPAMGFVFGVGTATVTPGGGFTELYETSHTTPDIAMETEYKLANDTTIDATLSASELWFMQGMEFKIVDGQSFDLQLRWSLHDQSPQVNTLTAAHHELAPGTTTPGWVMLRLGRLSLPTDTTVALGTLALELWGKSGQSGPSLLDIDYLLFLPTEAQATIDVPGGTTETWLPDQMSSPVTNPGSGTVADLTTNGGVPVRYFNATADNAGAGTNAGIDFVDGLHRTTWIVEINNNVTETVRLVVRNITDSTDTFSATVTVPYGKVSTFTRTWTAAASKFYQIQLDDPSSSQPLVLYEIRDEFVKSIVQNEKIRSDPGSTPNRYTVERLNTSSALVQEIEASTVPFVLPPGLSMVQVIVLDQPLVGYDENESVEGRTITITPTVYPRYPL